MVELVNWAKIPRRPCRFESGPGQKQSIMKIGIINSGVCNLFSLENFFRYLDINFISSSEPGDFLDCSHLILPGVGTFDAGMFNLKERGLDSFVQEKALIGTPILGICLGMQLLFESSEEGSSQGLGLLPGKIKRFPRSLKRVPHIGWNEVSQKTQNLKLYNNIQEKTCFYFIHSTIHSR